MNSGDSEEHPLLTLLLNERLPTLGLDAETYGPYIVALFPISETPDDSTGEEVEGWDEILELLQASSELQDLEDSVWEQLRADLVSTWHSYRELQIEQHREKLMEKEQHLQKMLEVERDMALINAETKINAPAGALNGSNTNSSIDDAAKRALLNRFGYEDETNDDSGGKEGGANKSKADATDSSNVPTSTKPQHPPITTKREEQQKTKAAQQQKVDAKEERRKRAVKGERRR